MDSETQTTPKKKVTSLDINVKDSPLTKKLIEKVQKVEMMLRMTRKAIKIKKRSRNLFNKFRNVDLSDICFLSYEI